MLAPASWHPSSLQLPAVPLRCWCPPARSPPPGMVAPRSAPPDALAALLAGHVAIAVQAIIPKAVMHGTHGADRAAHLRAAQRRTVRWQGDSCRHGVCRRGGRMWACVPAPKGAVAANSSVFLAASCAGRRTPGPYGGRQCCQPSRCSTCQGRQQADGSMRTQAAQCAAASGSQLQPLQACHEAPTEAGAGDPRQLRMRQLVRARCDQTTTGACSHCTTAAGAQTVPMWARVRRPAHAAPGTRCC